MSFTTTPQPQPRKFMDATSSFHGVHVSKEPRGTFYMSRLCLGYGKVFLGRYETEQEAAMMWDTAVLMIYDKPQYLNFPTWDHSLFSVLTDDRRQRVYEAFHRPAARKVLDKPEARELRDGLEKQAPPSAEEHEIEDEIVAMKTATEVTLPLPANHIVISYKITPQGAVRTDHMTETVSGCQVITYDPEVARTIKVSEAPAAPAAPAIVRFFRWLGRQIGIVVRRYFSPTK